MSWWGSLEVSIFLWPGIPFWFCRKLPWTNQSESVKECLSWKLCGDSQKLDVLSSFPQHIWHILRWALPHVHVVYSHLEISRPNHGWVWLGFGSNLVVRNLGLAQKIQRDSKVTQLLLKVVPVIEMPCSMHEAIHVVEGNSVPTQCAIISLNVHIVNFERCSLALLGVFKYIWIIYYVIVLVIKYVYIYI